MNTKSTVPTSDIKISCGAVTVTRICAANTGNYIFPGGKLGRRLNSKRRCKIAPPFSVHVKSTVAETADCTIGSNYLHSFDWIL